MIHSWVVGRLFFWPFQSADSNQTSSAQADPAPHPEHQRSLVSPVLPKISYMFGAFR